MDRKYQWQLQIYWNGGWRKILESDKRSDLVEYARTCPEHLQLRIIDTTEEVKARGNKRH